jgi:hypothetical protein
LPERALDELFVFFFIQAHTPRVRLYLHLFTLQRINKDNDKDKDSYHTCILLLQSIQTFLFTQCLAQETGPAIPPPMPSGPHTATTATTTMVTAPQPFVEDSHQNL